MSLLTIRWKKKNDGANSMTCIRAEGSVTGQRQDDNGFFVRHDMTHYTVETTLGLRRAFFGLLADGWDIDDFGTPWPRGPIPPDALPDASLAEHLAGAFDLERYGGVPIVAADFNKTLAEVCAEYNFTVRAITEDDLTCIRARLAALEARWEALPAGNTLEVAFF
jgi:hypothetical protein